MRQELSYIGSTRGEQVKRETYRIKQENIRIVSRRKTQRGVGSIAGSVRVATRLKTEAVTARPNAAPESSVEYVTVPVSRPGSLFMSLRQLAHTPHAIMPLIPDALTFLNGGNTLER